jgi:mRNA-degrading endonuclease YafQ of YafQ-DinJ toxin-antitoxin module
MLLEIGYSPSFVRLYKKLHPDLQVEVKEKINLFKSPDNHDSLRVHKLSGKLKNQYSFSVNYSDRIIFEYLDKGKNSVVLLHVGSHAIYK